MANNIRRATERAQDARYGKAVSSLLSLGTCPVTEDSLKEMSQSTLAPVGLLYLL